MLYAATIFVSAFLLFLVQPLIAKQILPWFGGTAGVWTVCLVFFQLTLLAGYVYADLLTRLRMRRQALVHTVLLVAACACLPILANPAWKPTGDSDPTTRILLLLTVTIGLPYLAVCTTGPLLQSWFARVTPPGPRRNAVYRLFALSNFASLAALVAYPFYFERVLALRTQGWAWSGGFVVFALLAVAAAWRTTRAVETAESLPQVVSTLSDSRALGLDDEPEADADTAGPPPTLGACLEWLVLAALGTVMLLAVTTYITQDVAAVPFLWILPLALYLLTFILVFDSAFWYRRWLFWPALMLVAPAMAWSLAQPVHVLWQTLTLFAGGLFVICMFCHGELARARPEPRWLTRFYLKLSVGGALGGLLVGLVAPHVFSGPWELPIGLAATLAMLVVVARGAVSLPLVLLLAFGLGETLWLAPGFLHVPPKTVWGVAASVAITLVWIVVWVKRSTRAGAAVLAGFAAAVCVWLGARYHTLALDSVISMTRSFYGTLIVREYGSGDAAVRVLQNGVIAHGSQYRSPEFKRLATSYYGDTSGAGIAIAKVNSHPQHIGVIGLGTGTVATYGTPGGTVRYYEINPGVVDVARTQFTYLGDSESHVDVVLGDARLSLEREAASGQNQKFDVLIVDAFSSDSIPVHLLTREALAVYRRHMAPGGVIAFHVSNRYLDLVPVVGEIAHDAGLEALEISDNPDKDRHWLRATTYVLVTDNAAFLSDPQVAGRGQRVGEYPGVGVWTDDFSNLIRILK